VGEVPEAGVDVAAPGPPDNATDVPELVGVGGTVDVETETADDDKVTDVDGRVGTSGVGEAVGTDVVGESSASPGSRTVYLRNLNFIRTVSCHTEHENTAHESVYDYI
jgi:hypothetical protein